MIAPSMVSVATEGSPGQAGRRPHEASAGLASPVDTSSREPLDTTMQLETPEHITFRYQLAGPARRAAAYGVDLLVRGLIVMATSIIAMISSIAWFESLQGLEVGVMLVVFFALEWGYYLFFDIVWSGSSPGKKAFRLRAIHREGRPLNFTESVLRNLLRAADLLPFLYAIGVSVMLMDSQFRRLGDLVAGTVVVFEPRTQLGNERPSQVAWAAAGLPARPRLSTEERAALALFHRRLPLLSRARAEELANIIAPVFRERFQIEDAPAVELLEALHERTARA